MSEPLQIDISAADIHLLVGGRVRGGVLFAQKKKEADFGTADGIGVAVLHEPRRPPAPVPHQEVSGKPRVPAVVSGPRE